jgi:hypothetical protein
MHIVVDVVGLPDEQLTLIAKKLGQATSVINVHWYRV